MVGHILFIVQMKSAFVEAIRAYYQWDLSFLRQILLATIFMKECRKLFHIMIHIERHIG